MKMPKVMLLLSRSLLLAVGEGTVVVVLLMTVMVVVVVSVVLVLPLVLLPVVLVAGAKMVIVEVAIIVAVEVVAVVTFSDSWVRNHRPPAHLRLDESRVTQLRCHEPTVQLGYEEAARRSHRWRSGTILRCLS
jgi:hypothetical protein